MLARLLPLTLVTGRPVLRPRLKEAFQWGTRCRLHQLLATIFSPGLVPLSRTLETRFTEVSRSLSVSVINYLEIPLFPHFSSALPDSDLWRSSIALELPSNERSKSQPSSHLGDAETPIAWWWVFLFLISYSWGNTVTTWHCGPQPNSWFNPRRARGCSYCTRIPKNSDDTPRGK